MTQLVMFMVGVALYSSTVLIPQFLQEIMGYSARQAGMAVSSGGLVLMVLFPVAGALAPKFDPRKLVAMGFVITTFGLWRMSTINPNISFGQAVSWRVFIALGLPFLFIPINTISYTGVARSENNDVAGLTNLARNIGGSVGTAFVATMLSRGAQAHEAVMIRNLTPDSPGFQQQVNALKHNFGGGGSGAGPGFGGGSGAGGIQQAQAFIYNQLHRQSAMLAYMDIVVVLAVFCALMIPLVMLIGKIKPAADGPAMH